MRRGGSAGVEKSRCTTVVRSSLCRALSREDDTVDNAIARIEQLTRDQYAEFVDAVEGRESPLAQTFIFADAARRLAESGIPLGMLLRLVARVYRLDLQDLEVLDSSNEALVRYH